MLQKLTFNKAITDTEFAKEVFRKLPLDSFDNETEKILAKEINRYYLTNDKTMTENTLKMYIEGRLDDGLDQDKAADVIQLVEDTYAVTTELDEGAAIKQLDKHVRRSLTLKTLKEFIAKDKLDDESALEGLGKEITGIALLDTTNSGDENFLDLFNDTDRKIELYKHLRTKTHPTGFLNIDNMLDGGGLGRGEVALIIAGTGKGKSLGNGTPVYTPEGPVSIEKLTTGDKVIGTDGKAHNVIGVFPQGKLKTYEIEFSDGTIIRNNDEHIWTFQTARQRQRTGGWTTTTLRDMIDNYEITVPTGKYQRKNMYLPIAEPVEYPEKELKIDPYLLGALLGDGGLTCQQAIITNGERDILDKIEEGLSKIGYQLTPRNSLNGYRIIMNKKSKKNYMEGLGKNSEREDGKLTKTLKEYNLAGKDYHEKFIPQDYLYGSVEQRLEILRGLIDTDGGIEGSAVRYSSSSEELSEGVRELANSLGMVAKIHEKQPYYTHKGERKPGRTSYIVTIKLAKGGLIPFTSEKHTNAFSYGQTDARRYVVDIRETEEYESMTCISVDAEDKLFLTENYVPTHNTTIAVQAATNYVNQGMNVLYVTLEEKLERISVRLESNLLGAHMTDFYDENEMINEDLIRAAGDMYKDNDDLGNLYISKHSPREVSIEKLEQVIINTKLRKGLDVDFVVIDYPALMNVPGKNKTHEEQGELFERIRGLAQKYNFIALTLAQTNRTAWSADVETLNNIEGGFMVANACELVLTVNRTQEEYEEGFFRMHIDKVRNRSTRPIPNMLSFAVDTKGYRMRATSPQEQDKHLNILKQAGREDEVDGFAAANKTTDKINEKLQGGF